MFFLFLFFWTEDMIISSYKKIPYEHKTYFMRIPIFAIQV